MIGLAKSSMATAPRTRVYATWNANALRKSTHITLSSGNLKATNDGATNNHVKATIGKSSGKWYWELTFTRDNPSDQWFVPYGLTRETENVENYPGATTGNCISTEGSKWINGTQTAGYTSAWLDTDVIGVALDMDAGTVTLYKNNVSLGILQSGLTGTWYPATGSSVIPGFTIANFGESAFVYSPPAGFNPGVYTD